MVSMKYDNLKLANNIVADVLAQIDQEAIIEQIWENLGGTASRLEIRNALIEVAPKYADARIMTYVPIFLGRDVRRRLQVREYFQS